MNDTQIRDTLATVADAVPVPVPDPASFQRRVTGARRRRTAGRAAGALAALAVVSSGAVLVVSLGDASDRATPAHETAVEVPDWAPVLIEDHVRIVSADGVIGPELIGPEGPDIATIVGTTPHGVVVLTDDGTLARIEESLRPLVPGRVRTAYLEGNAVVYENDQGLIRWRGIEPAVSSTDSAQTDEGRLMAGGDDVFVTGGPGGLVYHDPEGLHRLLFEDPPAVVHQVETGGDVIAVRVDDELVFFAPDGEQTEERSGGASLGALAPDGHAYAQLSHSGVDVLLIDPRSADAEPVEGPTSAVSDLGWAPDGDLLIVAQDSGRRTLWRCAPDGTGCTAQAEDPTATLRLD